MNVSMGSNSSLGGSVSSLGGTNPISATSSEDNANCSKRARSSFLKLQRRVPALKKASEMALRVPPRWRVAFVIFWIGWKVVLTLVVVFIYHKAASRAVSTNRGILPGVGSGPIPTRVLYIVTTLAEYNNGKRATVRGQDRLGEVVIPVIVDNVRTMVDAGFHVDVFLIASYEMKSEREQHLRQRLPSSVGLQVWDDACPIGYERTHDQNRIVDNTRALARQHRYVIKDKLPYYDLFAAFEDDMRISGRHLRHYLEMSAELEKLRFHGAGKNGDGVAENLDDPRRTKFFGSMSQKQIDRLLPGFVRVEVLLDDNKDGAQTELDPVSLDYRLFDNSTTDTHIDPTVCCHVPDMTPNVNTPRTPSADDLVVWETNIRAFTLRELPHYPGRNPEYDWMVVMLGPGKRLDKSELIGGYWSGRDGAFGADLERPTGGPPTLIAQQGGWMATRQQIMRLNAPGSLCQGSFLPPFSQPVYYEDGQQSMNVEFWSGSYQLFTGVRGGCNMQRLISLRHFSHHLLYHAANNKQIQLNRERMVRADHLFGQLNAVRKAAIKAKGKTTM